MLKKLLNTTQPFKNLPHDVKKISMRASGSKYAIEVHCDDMPAAQIGRYDTKEEAHKVMEQLASLTKCEIIK